MSTLTGNGSHGEQGMFGAGTAALRKIITRPLMRAEHEQQEPERRTAFNSCASDDPISVVLEGDIIPRLLMAHMIDGSFMPRDLVRPKEARPKDERMAIKADDTHAFAALPLRMEAPDLMKEIERFLEQGASVEDVLLDLLAPAARHLGELWERDECDFIEVTMGLWRLQEVMREISPRFPAAIDGARGPRSAVFCPIPGDVHSFGAQMLEEVFARAGWQSEVLMQPERRELLDYLARTSIDMIGLTVSRDCPVSALSSLVRAIRSVSMNPNLCVLVGGSLINRNPALVAEIGADGTGRDAKAALETAERLVSAAPVRAFSMI